MEITVGALAVTAIAFGDGSHTVRLRNTATHASIHTQRCYQPEEIEDEIGRIAEGQGVNGDALFDAVLSLWTQPGNGERPHITVISAPITEIEDD